MTVSRCVTPKGRLGTVPGASSIPNDVSTSVRKLVLIGWLRRNIRKEIPSKITTPSLSLYYIYMHKIKL